MNGVFLNGCHIFRTRSDNKQLTPTHSDGRWPICRWHCGVAHRFRASTRKILWNATRRLRAKKVNRAVFPFTTAMALPSGSVQSESIASLTHSYRYVKASNTIPWRWRCFHVRAYLIGCSTPFTDPYALLIGYHAFPRSPHTTPVCFMARRAPRRPPLFWGLIPDDVRARTSLCLKHTEVFAVHTHQKKVSSKLGLVPAIPRMAPQRARVEQKTVIPDAS